MKPKLVVSLPLVWGVRNVLRSGLAERLSRDFHVLYAIPEEAREDFLNEGIPEADTWTLVRPSPDRRTAWAQRLLHAAHALRNPSASDGLFEWRRRDRPQLRRRIRAGFFRGAARLVSADAPFARLRREEEDLFTRSIPDRVWDFLRQANPAAGLSTSCVVDWERPLFQAMRTLGIPTATHVLSFDNLTSRGYLPLRHFSRFLVWQTNMADELRRFYGVGAERTTVTGTPQFDFHVRPEFRWSRARTEEVLGVRPDRPYFVYCANHNGITPNEPAMLAHFLRSFSEDARLRNHQWVVRLHPMDTYSRWTELEASFPNVVISRPWKHRSDSRFWAIPSADEIGLLGNTLRYADATVTVASTTALDSAVVGTPVVGVGFHPTAAAWEGRFYRDCHFSEHYRPLMETGALPLATGMEELHSLLAAAVGDRDGLREERAEMVRRLCGVVDGNTVERIARAMLGLLAAPARSPVLERGYEVAGSRSAEGG